MSKVMSIAQLKMHVDSKIATAMKDVSEAIKDEQQNQIEKVVYRGYIPGSPDGEPWEYERRREDGGLADRDNMIENIIYTANGVELLVKNITKGSDDNFEIADLVEYGDGHNGKYYSFKYNRDDTSWKYLSPRPFTKYTTMALERSRRHVEALRDGLRAQGIKVI